MIARYPCQDPAGLPADLAQALERWAVKPPERVGGWCYRAYEDILHAVAQPDDLRLVGGYVRLPPGSRSGGMTHWWLELGERIIDPTRQQLGPGGVSYWRGRPEYQGDDGYKLLMAMHLTVGGITSPAEGEARLFATVCEPEPCYTDQGWQRAQRVMRRAA